MYLIADLGIGKQEDKQPKHLEKSRFLLPFPGSFCSFTPDSSLPPCYHHRLPTISPSSEEQGYTQDLAVPLCCSLLVVLLRSGAGLPLATVNIAFPNHRLMQGSVLRTPRAGHSACCWVRSPSSGGIAPCAGWTQSRSIRRGPEDAR